MSKIIDPVFGEMEYNEKDGCWKKNIFLGIWGADDQPLNLLVKCGEKEEITEKQRDAYKSYLANLKKYSNDVPGAIFFYYKEHYEDFNRCFPLPDELKMEVVDDDATLSYFMVGQLYIDRKGNYGWLSNFISPQYPITVILSDGKPRIFKGWTILKSDYSVVDDDVFGEMYFDLGWKKEIKTNLNGIEDEWVLLQAAASKGKNITSEQKSCYQKYLKNEKAFLEEYPHALLEYYLSNYELIAEIWNDADLFDKEEITPESIKSLIQFQTLYFNRDGIRYGWLCKCAWDRLYGLSLYYDDNYEGICVGSKEDLFL